MISKIYSIFDSKIEAYMQPFYSPANGSAIRAFTTAMNDANCEMAKYPADYTLFELGSFDDSTGKFNMLSTPRSLGVGVEFVKAN